MNGQSLPRSPPRNRSGSFSSFNSDDSGIGEWAKGLLFGERNTPSTTSEADSEAPVASSSSPPSSLSRTESPKADAGSPPAPVLPPSSPPAGYGEAENNSVLKEALLRIREEQQQQQEAEEEARKAESRNNATAEGTAAVAAATATSWETTNGVAHRKSGLSIFI